MHRSLNAYARIVSLMSIVFFVLTAGFSKANDIEQLTQDIEKECIAYRDRNFSAIDVTMLIDFPVYTKTATGRSDQQTRMTISVDDGQIRKEYTSRQYLGTDGAGKWTKWCAPDITIYDGKRLISDIVRDAGVSIIAPTAVKDLFEKYGLFDVRALGMSCGPLNQLHRGGLYSIFGNNEFSPISIDSEANEKDGELIRIHYKSTRVPGEHLTVWVDKNRGPNIVKIRKSQSSNSDASISEIVEENIISLRRVGEKDLWFPHVINYQFKVSGQMVPQESVTVEDVQWIPHGDSRFTLEGLGLTEGRNIFDVSQGRALKYVWKSGKAVEVQDEVDVPTERHVEVRTSSIRVSFIILNVIVLAIFAALFLRRAIKA